MSRIMLRILGFLALLSGSRSDRHFWTRRFADTIRVALLLLLVTASTIAFSSCTSSLIDPSAARSKAAGMIGANFLDLEEALGGALSLTMLQGDDDVIALRVAVGSVPPPYVGALCAEPIEQDTLCLYRVRNYLPSWVPTWIASHFRQIDFPTTAYSISEVAIEAALRNPDVSLTRARRDEIRADIERALEDVGIFLPTGSDLLLARQLNGPVQAVTFALGFWAIGIMLFLALGSLIPNLWVRQCNRIEIEQETAQPIAITEEADPSSSDSGVSEDTPAVEEAIRTTPTPWSRSGTPHLHAEIADAQAFSQYYQRIADYFHDRSSFIGVSITPAVLRFRTAATRALANTQDTSILPVFLDAERQSVDDDFRARLSTVRFLLWAIPTVGFIGTIIGVSNALSATTGLQAARELTSATAQSNVSAAMGMAFDTTLVALVVAVVLMFLYHGLEGAEERMTVLEQNNAEKEVLQIARRIRKPGDAGALAQQLIALGVNTEALVRDLELFQKAGPEIAHVINALRHRTAEMDALLAQVTKRQRSPSRWILVFALIAVVIALYALAENGLLGRAAQDAIKSLFEPAHFSTPNLRHDQ